MEAYKLIFGKDPWKLTFSFSDSEKLLYVLKLPAKLLSRKNDDFLIFWTCPESKSMHFLKFGHFLKNGSPGQTTMLTGRAAKFCVEPRSPFSYISHHDPKTLGKRLMNVDINFQVTPTAAATARLSFWKYWKQPILRTSHPGRH